MHTRRAPGFSTCCPYSATHSMDLRMDPTISETQSQIVFFQRRPTKFCNLCFLCSLTGLFATNGLTVHHLNDLNLIVSAVVSKCSLRTGELEVTTLVVRLLTVITIQDWENASARLSFDITFMITRAATKLFRKTRGYQKSRDHFHFPSGVC